MLAGTHDMMFDAGATFTFPFVWLAGCEPVDITGFSARFQAGTAEDEMLILDETTGVAVGGVDGKFVVSLTPEQTALFMEGSLYYYEFEAVSPSGVVTRLLRGTFEPRAEYFGA